MTNFPRNDFALAKYLLEADKVNSLVSFLHRIYFFFFVDLKFIFLFAFTFIGSPSRYLDWGFTRIL